MDLSFTAYANTPRGQAAIRDSCAWLIQRWWRQHPSREIDDDTLLEDNEWDTCECCRAVVKVTFGLTCDGYSIANDDVTGEM